MPPIPAAAPPTRRIFDPWNSVSTGHQRAEDRESGSVSWRVHRTAKLQHQFNSDNNGGKGADACDPAIAAEPMGPGDTIDPVGEARVRRGVAGTGDIAAWMRGDGVRGGHGAPRPRSDSTHSKPAMPAAEADPLIDKPSPGRTSADGDATADATAAKPPPIFAHLTVYINGSTAPHVSDHRLKQLLAAHGARVALGLGRRSVTHVIIGTPNGGRGAGVGAGGGLAAGKLEKEVRSKGRGGGGVGTRYVSVEWVLESIAAGKRLPEARFPGVRTAPAGVGSVRDNFLKGKAKV